MSVAAMVAPNATAFAAEIEAEARNNPAQRAQLDALKATLDRETSGGKLGDNMQGVLHLEKLLGTNPEFKNTIRQLALNNPAALEKIVPQALGNPAKMQELVAATAAAQPAPQKAAPQVVATTAPPPLIRSVVAEPAATVQAPAQPAAPAKQEAVTGMAELAAIPGFGELMERVEKNPQLKDMFSSMTEGNNAAQTQKTIQSILDRAGPTPEARAKSTLFTDLVKTIDEKPGMVSSIASSFANDPKTGMMMIGMYSQFNQGFGQMLDGFFGEGALDGMLQGVLEYVGKMLGQSGGLMSMSNDGGGLLNKALNALGATPAQVNQVDPDTGTVTAKTGAAFKADVDKPAVAVVQPGSLDEQQRRAGPGQMPGMQPLGA